jgi:hypothetical protein
VKVEKLLAVEGSSRRGKPVSVDLGAKKVHSSSIFHFREETPAVEPSPVVEAWVRWLVFYFLERFCWVG